MAIINSIVVEKARGSIGNVTFSRVGYVDVAKQKPDSGVRKSTPLQVTKQRKLENNYKAYSFLNLSLKGWKPYKRQKENIWNCFARVTNSFFSSDSYSENVQAANELCGHEIGFSPDFKTTIISRNANQIKIHFNHSNDSQYLNKYLLLAAWNPNLNAIITKEVKLTQLLLNRGYVTFDYPQGAPSRGMFYAYTKKGNYCSGIKFRVIPFEH